MKIKKGLLALELPAKQIGNVKRRKDSSKLYVDFYYFGHRITRSTELDDTPANEMKVRDFLSRITERIETGSFKFAEAFPGSTKKEKAFFTNLEGREYRPEPHQVMFSEYVKEWKKTTFPFFSSPTKRRDYKSQNVINREYIREDADFPSVQVFDAGLRFLDTNATADNWLLQIETFDPHEPFHAPASFKKPFDTQAGVMRIDFVPSKVDVDFDR